MSIKQKRTLTEASVTAHRQNAQKSRGPATPEGRQMQRNASLRHGFYSKDRDTALVALGEDPTEFDAMVQAVHQKYAPADGFEEALAMRLARAMWRMDRADRSLEGHAVRQAQEASQWRESRVHAQMMRMKMTGASLLSLAQSVARNHYVTSPADLAMMNSLLPEESLKEIGDIMLALFLQLRQPGAHDEQGQPVDPYEKSRRALQKFKEIFGLAGDAPPVVRRPLVPGQEPLNQPVQPGTLEAPPNPDEVKKPALPVEPQGPQLSPEEWAKREPVRQLLENLLARQADLCEVERTNLLRQFVAGPSTFECAAVIAPTQASALVMQRQQDSAFREVWRISNLLLKLQRQASGPDSVRRRPGAENGRDRSSRSFSPNTEPPLPSAPEYLPPGLPSARMEVEPTLRSAPAGVTVSATAPATTPHSAATVLTTSVEADVSAKPWSACSLLPLSPPRACSRKSRRTCPRTSSRSFVRTLDSGAGKLAGEKATASRSHSKTSRPGSAGTSLVRSALSGSSQRGQKKDVKMKVYPEKSNRISARHSHRAGTLGRGKLEIGNWKLEIGNWKLETGNSQSSRMRPVHPNRASTHRTLRDANQHSPITNRQSKIGNDSMPQ